MYKNAIIAILVLVSLNFYLPSHVRSSQFGDRKMSCSEAMHEYASKMAVQAFSNSPGVGVSDVFNYLQRSGFFFRNAVFDSDKVTYVFVSKEYSLPCYSIFYPGVDGGIIRVDVGKDGIVKGTR